MPSEVLARATTFDLMVTDVLATYETYESYKQAGQVMPQDDANVRQYATYCQANESKTGISPRIIKSVVRRNNN